MAEENRSKMRNRKLWLVIKALFVLAISFHFYYYPPTDPFRKWLRITIILVFTISLLIDGYKFSKRK